MSFAAGQFSRLYRWTDDRDGGIKILASRMDAEMDGFATGLSTCLLKDGTQIVTANIPMGGFKFTGLAAGSGAGDSVRYEQVVLLSAAANQTITRSAAGTTLTLESTDAGATSGPDLSLHRNSASPADNDVLGSVLFDGEDDGGAQTTYARIQATALDVTNATEDGNLRFGVMTGGTLADELILTGANFYPAADDGLALGLSGTAFADLFLASGAVINFNAGDVTITHSSNALTIAGGVVEFSSTPTIGGVAISRVNSTDADALLDTLGSETTGAMIYHNGTTWVVLAPP